LIFINTDSVSREMAEKEVQLAAARRLWGRAVPDSKGTRAHKTKRNQRGPGLHAQRFAQVVWYHAGLLDWGPFIFFRSSNKLHPVAPVISTKKFSLAPKNTGGVGFGKALGKNPSPTTQKTRLQIPETTITRASGSHGRKRGPLSRLIVKKNRRRGCKKQPLLLVHSIPKIRGQAFPAAANPRESVV